MSVEVRLFANFREIMGKSNIHVEADNVSDLLKKIWEEHKELGNELYQDKEKEELKEFVNIMVNGKSIDKINGLNTELEEGDKVAIFPPVTGG